MTYLIEEEDYYIGIIILDPGSEFIKAKNEKDFTRKSITNYNDGKTQTLRVIANSSFGIVESSIIYYDAEKMHYKEDQVFYPVLMNEKMWDSWKKLIKSRVKNNIGGLFIKDENSFIVKPAMFSEEIEVYDYKEAFYLFLQSIGIITIDYNYALSKNDNNYSNLYQPYYLHNQSNAGPLRNLQISLYNLEKKDVLHPLKINELLTVDNGIIKIDNEIIKINTYSILSDYIISGGNLAIFIMDKIKKGNDE